VSKLLRTELVELQWLGTLRAHRLLAKSAGDQELFDSVQEQIDAQMFILSGMGLVDEYGDMDKHCQKATHRAFVLTMIWKTNFKNEEIDYV